MWQYVAALMLIGHGIGHLTGILAAWTSINPGFVRKPWIFPGNQVIDSSVGKAWSGLWLISTVLFVASGIAVLMSEDSWRFLAIAGSAVSIAAMGPWWNAIMAGAKAGILLDVAILLVLLLPWGDGITDFFEVP